MRGAEEGTVRNWVSLDWKEMPAMSVFTMDRRKITYAVLINHGTCLTAVCIISSPATTKYQF